MWKLFFIETNLSNSVVIANNWKEILHNKLNISVKKYFAEKVTVLFDNHMLFRQGNGIHENLMDALAQAELDMHSAVPLFPDVNFYLIPEKDVTFLAVEGLSDSPEYNPDVRFGIKVFDSHAELSDERKSNIKYSSWSSLVFSIELCNFGKGWINFTPSLEERARLQTKHIISSSNFKKNELSLLQKIQFDNTVEDFPQFDSLYNKLVKVMPKMENSLEDEWKNVIFSGEEPVYKPLKKNKM